MDDVVCISLTRGMFWYELLLEEKGRGDRKASFPSTWLLVPSMPLCYLPIELVKEGLLELAAMAHGVLQLLPPSLVQNLFFIIFSFAKCLETYR